MDTIEVTFKYLIYTSPSGSSIYQARLVKNQESITIVDVFSDVILDEVNYKVTGTYTEHSKYGIQFKAQHVEEIILNSYERLIEYFSGPHFPGIGIKFATLIVDKLKENCLQLIQENPDILDRVPKMTVKRKDTILKGIAESQQKGYKVIQFLNVKGLGSHTIAKIQKEYGNQTIELLSENPYRMMDDIYGVSFQMCDALAHSLQFPLTHPYRLEAYLVSMVMQSCFKTGDTYISYENLRDMFTTSFHQEEFEVALTHALKHKKLYQEESYIFHASQYLAETYIANYLLNFPCSYNERSKQADILPFIEIQQKADCIDYDQKQINAISSLFEHDFMILTGGPGTGKTTVVKAMVDIYKKIYPQDKIACIAPTGRAAKRLMEICNVESFTIHSLLKWDLHTNVFSHDSSHPIEYDVLIIDEFSMVDNYLFYKLLQASLNVKKICIIGDEDQLPSVSCGRLLKDLIESNCFQVIRLKHIFRQSSGNDIISLAEDIKQNQVDFSSYKQDIKFFQTNEYNTKDMLLQVVQHALDKGYTLNDIQVLSCMYAGICGIEHLNIKLQEMFNPKEHYKKEYKLGKYTFREQDKVLQLKNQPEDNVYNGDIGTLIEIVFPIEDIDNKLRFIVDFDGNYVEYYGELLQNITLAYCISVHKSQGSEYPIVIMPIVKSQNKMLQKKLLYTAITRAKKSLVLLGELHYFLSGVRNENEVVRKSTLVKRFCI